MTRWYRALNSRAASNRPRAARASSRAWPLRSLSGSDAFVTVDSLASACATSSRKASTLEVARSSFKNAGWVEQAAQQRGLRKIGL
jgi:hypothetical protein